MIFPRMEAALKHFEPPALSASDDPTVAVWAIPGISANDVRAWLVLWAESGQGAEAVALTFEWLAEVLGKSRSTAQRYLQTLTAAGLVRRVGRELRGFRYAVVNPVKLLRPRLAKPDPQRTLWDEDRDSPSPTGRGQGEGESCGVFLPTNGPRNGFCDAGRHAGLRPVCEQNPPRPQPVEPSKPKPKPAPPPPGARAPSAQIARCLELNNKYISQDSDSQTQDPNKTPRDLPPTFGDLAGDLLAGTGQDSPSPQPSPGGRGGLLTEQLETRAVAFTRAVERETEKILADVADPSWRSRGFARKLAEMLLLGEFAAEDLAKIVWRLNLRRRAAPGSAEGLAHAPHVFFIGAVMRRYQETNGRPWPKNGNQRATSKPSRPDIETVPTSSKKKGAA